ncbi:MAG: hypothetical protein WA782_11655 [Sulfitobacter sp.]
MRWILVPAVLLLAGCAFAEQSSANKGNITMEEIEKHRGETYSDAVARLGAPREEVEFELEWEQREFRIELRNFFDRETIENEVQNIRESTWALSDRQNLTIWFHQKDASWQHLLAKTWVPGQLF